jgi:cysteine sulfinate desulfinase/cysteine desulfurase-like protein
MSRKIYLDFNASTPIYPEAVEAMRPFLFEHYGNPSSLHWAGIPAKDAVGKARGQVAALLGCDPTERLPNTLNLNFVGRVGADVLAMLPGVAASTGSACHAGSVTLSPVLAAMGVPPEEGHRAEDRFYASQ